MERIFRSPSQAGRDAASIARDSLRAVGSVVPPQLIRDLANSDFPEVQTVVCWAAFERPGAIEGYTDRWQAALSLCLEFLTECILRNYRDDEVVTRYDGAGYLLILFQRMWELEREDGARRISDSLARLCRGAADPQQADAVITGVLEHLLADPRVAEFFSAWKADLALSTVYDKAIRLARSLADFQKSADYNKLKREFDQIDALPPEDRERAILEQARKMLGE
jgi:hypothetical protein